MQKIVLLLADILLINSAVYIALLFRFDGKIPVQYINVFLHSTLWLTGINVTIYYFCRLYSSLWKYASVEELFQVFVATFAGVAASLTFGLLLGLMLPRTVYAISWMLTFLFIGSTRLSYRVMRRLKNMSFIGTDRRKRVMVIGAGFTGSMVIKEMKSHYEGISIPVVMVDDNYDKHRSHVHGVPVKGDRTKIKELAEKYRVDEIIIAIPSATKKEMKEILEICKLTKCKLKTLPTINELINGEVDITQVRDVNIEDLLGRDPVVLNMDEICGYLKDEVVLVTGGGGSIGSELCRQIARFNPKKLLIFDIYENNAYDLQNELRYIYKDALDMEVLIGSVQDRARLEHIFDTYHPGVVFHAAAHKHVPLMEANPTEAIKNNVFGTLNTAECADKYSVKKFVLISTDKAVNPTNIMGATKRVAEMIVQNMSRHSNTEFVAVRFGNVLGSNGSVIPLFKKQIAQGGPVTITHPDITRFFMTIPEASQLVLQAGAIAKGGEIFILDMGQPVKIMDLATDLIRLSGLEPGTDIEVKVTGLRPGEKLYEELLMAEEGLTATKHEKIFVGKPIHIDHKTLVHEINALKALVFGSGEDIGEYIERIVPTYSKVG
ncbi:nucleoside-diphosphate sugar epimerase/dehydratase [Petroclostridium sp. X23]|uniref:polysaccharide biosynthesis protein n=1 Tax=Petroclostridium sp. X23 TaxID=3045146 RepID=UPI0024AE8332|nr:nucleoside-diphosphate sugar epimerase/dehydratase [Petroclostridium sp. X23]WHH61716.1 nucleoside-diphosphate sugar epimerase/dehydratase [Petroclostridium sp. X23]